MYYIYMSIYMSNLSKRSINQTSPPRHRPTLSIIMEAFPVKKIDIRKLFYLSFSTNI